MFNVTLLHPSPANRQLCLSQKICSHRDEEMTCDNKAVRLSRLAPDIERWKGCLKRSVTASCIEARGYPPVDSGILILFSNTTQYLLLNAKRRLIRRCFLYRHYSSRQQCWIVDPHSTWVSPFLCPRPFSSLLQRDSRSGEHSAVDIVLHERPPPV